MRRMHVGTFGLASCLGLAVFAAGFATVQESRTTHTSVERQGPTTHAHAGPAAPTLSPQDAWARLRAGNARFVDGRPEHPNQSFAHRIEVAKGQHPYAIVLTCSDSRVPPEILFDTGLGDIFVIRVAGNTADDAAIASMEYAVEHLHVPLIVVLGHERCGAVQAAVQAVDQGERPPRPPRRDPRPDHARCAAATKGRAATSSKTPCGRMSCVWSPTQGCKPILAEAIHAQHLVSSAPGTTWTAAR